MEWTEVKPKQKRKAKPKTESESAGGFQPIQQSYGKPKGGTINQASAIADFDPIRNEGSDEEIKYETYSHECSVAVANARNTKEYS